MFLKMHIYVNIHLTAYLPFFSQDDILTTGVLMKQRKMCLCSLLRGKELEITCNFASNAGPALSFCQDHL